MNLLHNINLIKSVKDKGSNIFLSRKIALIAWIGLVPMLTHAQKVYHLNLDSAIAIAKKQSYSVQMLNEDLIQASYQLRSTYNSFLPQVELNGSIPNYSESLESNSDSLGIHYYTQKQSLLKGNVQLTQQLPTDGRIYLTSGVSDLRDLTHSVKNINVTSGIRIEQPLQALYAYNAALTRYKNAKLQFDLANKRFKREELNLIYNVSEAFYSLVSAGKQKEIAFQNLKRQEEAYNTAKNKYSAGLIKEVEALQLEVDLGDAVNQYDVQTTNCIQQANMLKQQLGLSLRDTIVAENKTEYKPVVVNADKAVEMGLKNRIEISEWEIQIKQAELQVKQQRAQGMISGTVSAYYDFAAFNSFSLGYPDETAIEKTTNNMLKKQGNRGLTLSLKVPLLDWGANRALVRLRQSQLKQNKMQLDNQYISIENEVRNKVNTLQSNLRRLQLLEKNVKLAEKSYNISYQRFTNGDIDAESLALDRIRYNNAQQSYLQAYISYKLGLLDLNRRTFYDFENDRPLVSE
jgi:outer membrane protein